jgi:hypothetical protein
MVRQILKDYFNSLEDKFESINEFSLGNKIKEILTAEQKQITDKEELAEYIAFEFICDYPTPNSWGTYYGPKIVWKDKDGLFKEFPSIKQIDETTLKYWRTRIDESKHPILINRYADLVFDFEPIVLNKSIDFAIAQKIIDTDIDICVKNLDDGLGCKSRLERALTLALKINDKQRLQSLPDLIIKIEDKFAEDNKPGIWGYAFKWLLLENNKKILLSDDEIKYLINTLESRLDRLMKTEDPNPWHVECATNLLGEYYSKNNDEQALKTTLDKLELAFRKNKYANSDGLLIINYLEKLKDAYLNYAAFGFAQKARDRIINELSNLGERGNFATKEINTEITLKNEVIAEFIKSIFENKKDNSLDLIILKIAINFIPRKKFVADQLNDLSRKHPITYFGSNLKTSEDGYLIAKFGSIEDAPEKHLLQNFSNNLHYQTILLRIAYEELKKRYTLDELLKTLLLSPIFKAEDKNYISKLFKAFWDKENLTCCCLSIPLIEDSIRNLYRINNQTFIQPNDCGGYDVCSLEKLLWRGLIKLVYQNIGEDMEYYFKVLLTDNIGWNLRNNFAHGINKNSFDDEDIAGRLIHVLFCLSLVRNNPTA